jgi:hypothetical protein
MRGTHLPERQARLLARDPEQEAHISERDLDPVALMDI